jgi:hypothetical protein
MVITHNTAYKNKMLDAGLEGGVGVDFNGGRLQFRSGAAPGANNAATGTLLAEVNPLPADSWNAAASNLKDKTAAAWSDLSADAAGTIGYCRLIDATSTYVIEFDVTATGGGGAVTVDNTVVAATQPVTVTQFSFSL